MPLAELPATSLAGMAMVLPFPGPDAVEWPVELERLAAGGGPVGVDVEAPEEFTRLAGAGPGPATEGMVELEPTRAEFWRLAEGGSAEREVRAEFMRLAGAGGMAEVEAPPAELERLAEGGSAEVVVRVESIRLAGAGGPAGAVCAMEFERLAEGGSAEVEVRVESTPAGAVCAKEFERLAEAEATGEMGLFVWGLCAAAGLASAAGSGAGAGATAGEDGSDVADGPASVDSATGCGLLIFAPGRCPNGGLQVRGVVGGAALDGASS